MFAWDAAARYGAVLVLVKVEFASSMLEMKRMTVLEAGVAERTPNAGWMVGALRKEDRRFARASGDWRSVIVESVEARSVTRSNASCAALRSVPVWSEFIGVVGRRGSADA